MDQQPLRCHMLIGPPSSGKSTVAAVLAEQVGGQVIATDAIRAELFGDEAIQGPWAEVEAVLHQRLHSFVADGVRVIVDATHSQRPFRLALTQALELPAPVQWIGWWLNTPLEQCLAWNRQRQRQVDEEVIKLMHRQVLSTDFKQTEVFRRRINEQSDSSDQAKKSRQAATTFINRHRSFLREEGFAAIVALNPTQISNVSDHVCAELVELDCKIRNASNRNKRIKLHRYSRLLDFERLIFLIRLLLEFPGLDLVNDRTDPHQELPDAQQLRRSFFFDREADVPPADELFASRAAFALKHRHGCCYGDEDAIAIDLGWLEQQGFVSALPVTSRIIPGSPSKLTQQAHQLHAGFPPAADAAVFQRQLGLLRHLIQNPFDHSTIEICADDGWNQENDKLESAKKRGAPRTRIKPLREHLLERLQDIEGISYLPTKKTKESSDADKPQVRTLDKDIETLIGHYGFRDILGSHHDSI